jgi:hypothetical protein
MAVYRIFPEKDAFIFSEVPSSNAGLDEIIELGGYYDKTGEGEAKGRSGPTCAPERRGPSCPGWRPDWICRTIQG